jgi:hypothetical protein
LQKRKSAIEVHHTYFTILGRRLIAVNSQFIAMNNEQLSTKAYPLKYRKQQPACQNPIKQALRVVHALLVLYVNAI